MAMVGVVNGRPKQFEAIVFFVTFGRLVAYNTLSNACFSRFGVHYNDDRAVYFTLCACVWGKHNYNIWPLPGDGWGGTV